MKEESDIITQLLDFNGNPQNDSIWNYYESPNTWKVLGIETKELYHSQFLAWLFNIELGGEKIFLKQFVNLIVRNGSKPIEGNKDLLAFRNAIITDSLRIVSCSIKTERPVNALSQIRASDRLDIYVNAEIEGVDKYSCLELVIENKVSSKEGSPKNVLKSIKEPTEEELAYKDKSQTERYYYACSKQECLRLEIVEEKDKLDATIQAFVFLSVSGQAKEANFINVSYQDLVDYVIEPFKERENLDGFTKQLIRDYLKNLCNPFNTTKMAITKTEKELLKQFYERNESLFLAALEVMVEDGDNTEERQKALDAVKEIAKQNKSSRRFFCINNTSGQRLRMYQVVAEFVCFKLRNGLTLDQIENEIKEYAKERGQTHVSTDRFEVVRGEKGYEFECRGTKYYVTKEWGLYENPEKKEKSFGGFMKHVNATYPDFRIVQL